MRTETAFIFEISYLLKTNLISNFLDPNLEKCGLGFGDGTFEVLDDVSSLCECAALAKKILKLAPGLHFNAVAVNKFGKDGLPPYPGCNCLTCFAKQDQTTFSYPGTEAVFFNCFLAAENETTAEGSDVEIVPPRLFDGYQSKFKTRVE